MREFKIHPLAENLPLMSDQEFEALKEDIRAHGQKVPILIFEGKLLDGRNRYRACLELGVEPLTEPFKGTTEEAEMRSFSNNMMRRHLSISQKAMVLVRSNIIQRQLQGDTRAYRKGEDSIRSIAKKYGVNHVSIYKAINVAQLDPTGKTAEDVLQGRISVAAAEKLLTEKNRDSNTTDEQKTLIPILQKFMDATAESSDENVRESRKLVEKALSALQSQRIP
jgi:ParB-like chromosome segregation protein Spo0J